jgi:fido (protein-threonine AMPylation protein)
MVARPLNHLSQNTEGNAPCQLVFVRDVIQNNAFKVNWGSIKKQENIIKSNQK